MKLFVFLLLLAPLLVSFGPLGDFDRPRPEIEKPWAYAVNETEFNKP